MQTYLCEDIKNEIIIEIESNIESLIIRYKEKLLVEEEYDEVFYLCSELLNNIYIEKYNKDIEEILLYILNKYKNDLYIGNYEKFRSMGMFRKLGNISFALNNINSKKKNLNKFYEFFTKKLIESVQIYLKDLNNKPLIFYNYDCIYGISGILYYLLDCNGANNKIIEELALYLIKLSKYKTYKGYDLIKFHIEKEQQLLEEEREKQPNGHINFGLAHGIIAPLIALTKTKYLNYNIEGIDDSIKRLFKLYNDFSILEDNILKFPTQLLFEDYINGTISNYSNNTGWCYGNIGIVRGLAKATNYMYYTDKYKYYNNELIKIINQPVERYNLHVPTLCHGYSSVIAIQISSFKETQDIRFLNSLERNIRTLIIEHKKMKKKDLNYEYCYNFSLLEGLGGVTLTLLNAISFDLNFDKLLMID